MARRRRVAAAAAVSATAVVPTAAQAAVVAVVVSPAADGALILVTGPPLGVKTTTAATIAAALATVGALVVLLLAPAGVGGAGAGAASPPPLSPGRPPPAAATVGRLGRVGDPALLPSATARIGVLWRAHGHRCGYGRRCAHRSPYGVVNRRRVRRDGGGRHHSGVVAAVHGHDAPVFGGRNRHQWRPPRRRNIREVAVDGVAGRGDGEQGGGSEGGRGGVGDQSAAAWAPPLLGAPTAAAWRCECRRWGCQRSCCGAPVVCRSGGAHRGRAPVWLRRLSGWPLRPTWAGHTGGMRVALRVWLLWQRRGHQLWRRGWRRGGSGWFGSGRSGVWGGRPMARADVSSATSVRSTLPPTPACKSMCAECTPRCGGTCAGTVHPSAARGLSPLAVSTTTPETGTAAGELWVVRCVTSGLTSSTSCAHSAHEQMRLQLRVACPVCSEVLPDAVHPCEHSMGLHGRACRVRLRCTECRVCLDCSSQRNGELHWIVKHSNVLLAGGRDITHRGLVANKVHPWQQRGERQRCGKQWRQGGEWRGGRGGRGGGWWGGRSGGCGQRGGGEGRWVGRITQRVTRQTAARGVGTRLRGVGARGSRRGGGLVGAAAHGRQHCAAGCGTGVGLADRDARHRARLGGGPPVPCRSTP